MSLPPVQVKDYALGEKIGAGTYGTVYKAMRKTGNKEVVAIKAIYKKGLSSREVDNIISEISFLKALKHNHIVEMIDFTWDNFYIYIIMEYCGGGDLSRIIKLKKSLPECLVKKFLQQLSSALQFLHSKNISHMDLKPQNILITHNKSLKLADFGFAKKIKLFEKEKGMRGSPLYMAPEMVLERQYDAKVDIWSVGVILYECLFGQPPYKSSSTSELFEKIKEDVPIHIPENGISPICRDLLKQCLQRHPEERIDFKAFLSHPFLDLEHFPGPKSYAKALELSSQAIEADKNEEFENAFQLYKESLEFFVPLIHAENDIHKKEMLRKKIDTFIIRAETLKEFLKPHNPSKEMVTTTSIPQESSQTSYDLKKLSGSTPGLKSSIEILENAELYEKEGKLRYALEQYESGLKILMPILINEPKGIRRTLMSTEVNKWMSQAERVKKRIEGQDALLQSIASESDSSKVLDKNCTIQ